MAKCQCPCRCRFCDCAETACSKCGCSPTRTVKIAVETVSCPTCGKEYPRGEPCPNGPHQK